MKSRKMLQASLVLAAATLLPLAAQAQNLKLTLGHGAAVGNPRHDASVKFAEVLKAKTGGRIEVQVAVRIARSTSFGAMAPGIRAAPMTASASTTSSAIAAAVAKRVRRRPPNRSSR